MSIRFGNNRIVAYVIVWLLSGTVLGLSGHFASIFLPKLHRDFVIFALVVPSATILALLLSVNWAQPWTEAAMLVTLSILWLSMGAWSTDLIGPIECSMLGSSTTPTYKNGTISSREFCYEMRVVQAFSWMLFGLIVLFTLLLFTLVFRAQNLGSYYIWNQHIAFVPWFGEWPQGIYPAGYSGAYYPQVHGQVMVPGAMPPGAMLPPM